MEIAKHDILLEASTLSCGESTYLHCPACGGAGKFSITVTDDGGVLYHCFRASCTLHSGGRVNGTARSTQSVQRIPAHRRWEGETAPLGEDARRRVGCGFDSDHFVTARASWAVQEQRVAFPILSPMGERRGWVLRSYLGAKPKALTYLDRADSIRMSHYPRKRGCVVVVEDIPSAVRASRYMSAVALLGTSCNLECAEELAQHYDHVVWALDADAVNQGRRLRREHSLVVRTSSVLLLSKDLKDMSEGELEGTLMAHVESVVGRACM